MAEKYLRTHTTTHHSPIYPIVFQLCKDKVNPNLKLLKVDDNRLSPKLASTRGFCMYDIRVELCGAQKIWLVCEHMQIL